MSRLLPARGTKTLLRAGIPPKRLDLQPRHSFAHNFAPDDVQLALIEETRGLEEWAERHRVIIRRFGRFPHRNARLGRETSAREQAFLDAGGFAG